MSLKFQSRGYYWQLRAGFPPMGSRERTDMPFLEALKARHAPLLKLSQHEIASWIVARLNFIASGSLESEGNSSANDTNEFGYKVRLADQANVTLAHGAIVFHVDRIHFASVDFKVDDFQSIFIGLLTDSPTELSKCEIIVHAPESKRVRTYGWNGYSLLNW